MGVQAPAAIASQDSSAFIEVADLTKRFGEVIAANRVSFDVRKGELFGCLGPNGAGKTTTINMLTGLARPDSGTIKIGSLECTRNPKAAQHLVGVFIAVSVSEIFEAQTFSNFFRFPMFFLCGLFFPIDALPAFARPISYALPLTYGVDILHGAIHQGNTMPLTLDLVAIGIFCVALFFISVRNIHRKWIV